MRLLKKGLTIGFRQTLDFIGEPRGDRTHDLRIKSPLLYQLS